MSTQNETAPDGDPRRLNRYEGDTEKASFVPPKSPVTQARRNAEADFAKICRRPVEVVRLPRPKVPVKIERRTAPTRPILHLPGARQ